MSLATLDTVVSSLPYSDNHRLDGQNTDAIADVSSVNLTNGSTGSVTSSDPGLPSVAESGPDRSHILDTFGPVGSFRRLLAEKIASANPTATDDDLNDQIQASLDALAESANPYKSASSESFADVSATGAASASTVLDIFADDNSADPDDSDPDYYKSSVRFIAGMIVSKLRDASTRNFAIGERFIRLQVWRKHRTPNYEAKDFEKSARDISADVRDYVSVKAESIQVAAWGRCWALRESLVDVVGVDGAARFTMYDLLKVVGKAYTFSSADVAGEIKAGWHDFFRSVASIRLNSGVLSVEGYERLVNATVQAIADSKLSGMTPEQIASKAASKAVADKRKAVNSANEKITTAVNDAIAGNLITPAGALAILETVASTHNKPLPATVGFNPETCTVADSVMLADAMFGHGKHNEMVALRNRLNAHLARIDAANSAKDAKIDQATRKVN